MIETDPITREIVKNALASAADEMAVALYRTAYSTVVRDCLDFSTSLCQADGEMIAQGVTIPLHLGSIPYAMETLFAKFGDDIEPEDVFILNDPFDGGMHIPSRPNSLTETINLLPSLHAWLALTVPRLLFSKALAPRQS